MAAGDDALKRTRRLAMAIQLRKLREQRAFTQERLALKADVDRSFYVGVESGHHTAKLEWFYAVADGLDVEIRDLFPVQVKDDPPRLVSAICYTETATRRGDAQPVQGGVCGDEHNVDVEQHVVPASREVAVRLTLTDSAAVLQRAFTTCHQDIPVCTTVSWIPDRLIANESDAEVLRRAAGHSGTVVELRMVGIGVTRVVERVRSRPATDREADRLRVPYGAPVMAVARQTFAGNDVVEAADQVYPLLDTELEFVTDLVAHSDP